MPRALQVRLPLSRGLPAPDSPKDPRRIRTTTRSPPGKHGKPRKASCKRSTLRLYCNKRRHRPQRKQRRRLGQTRRTEQKEVRHCHRQELVQPRSQRLRKTQRLRVAVRFHLPSLLVTSLLVQPMWTRTPTLLQFLRRRAMLGLQRSKFSQTLFCFMGTCLLRT